MIPRNAPLPGPVPTWPQVVHANEVITSAYGNTIRQALMDIWTNLVGLAGEVTIGGGGGVPPDRTISTTAPLQGGGPLTANRTLTIDTSYFVRPTLQINTTSPLTGGGALSGPLTLAINTASLVTAASLVQTTRNITTAAGSGLTGGGNLASDRPLAVDSSVVRTTRNITTGVSSGLTGGGPLSADVSLVANIGWYANGVTAGSGPWLNLLAGANVALDITGPSEITISATDGGGGGIANVSFVQINGQAVAAQPSINFVGGNNITLTPQTDLANNRVNVTIDGAAAGGGGISGVGFQRNGSPIANQAHVNFIEGTNVTITGANDQQNNRVNYTINAAFSTSGLVQTTRQIFTNAPLSGGGPLSADLTLSVDLSGRVPTNRTITTNAPLSGGGPLSGDLTLSVDLSGYVPTERTISAGAGLTGGGSLATNQTLSVALPVRANSGADVSPARPGLNFIGGDGVTVTATDNSAASRTDVTISATASTTPGLPGAGGPGINGRAGGGGGVNQSGQGGQGSCGGGTGGTGAGTNAAANSGSGGGALASYTANQGQGGSGRVVVTYQVYDSGLSCCLPKQTIITTSGAFNDPALIAAGGMAFVEAWGAGGGGAVKPSSGSGGGGGAGAYVAQWVVITASVTVTLGTGGTSGNAAGANGNAGGNTTFGALLTANGGSGGLATGIGGASGGPAFSGGGLPTGTGATAAGGGGAGSGGPGQNASK